MAGPPEPQATMSLEALRAALAGPLPDGAATQGALAFGAGVVSGEAPSPPPGSGPLVTTGSAASAATEWLAGAWEDTRLPSAILTGALVEEAASRWLAELLGLPSTASAAMATGWRTATVTCLAAARNHVLAAAGCDAERDGLGGAPPIQVLAAAGRASLVRPLGLLGIGTGALTPVAVDDQGGLLPDALGHALARGFGPAIVCAQLGEVDSGALDPLDEICALAHVYGAWVHVDGPFGLWARASPRLRSVTAGADGADSWATDCPNWLGVPSDVGLAFIAHARTPPAEVAGSLDTSSDGAAEPARGRPWRTVEPRRELPRRGRWLAVYSALASLGRHGAAAEVEGCCTLARRCAEMLTAGGLEVCNQVVLDRVLARLPGPEPEARITAALSALRRSETHGVVLAHWQGEPVVRITVSDWPSSTDDVEGAMTRLLEAAGG